MSKNKKEQIYTGKFDSNARGFGFVTVEGFERDLFIPQGCSAGAVYGDTVEVRITKGSMDVVAAELYCPQTGIALKQYTDEPGVQVYAGNFLDGTVTGKKGVVYNFRHAICLETQKYPDTPNKPEWPSALLKPGETYTSHCVFAFSTK